MEFFEGKKCCDSLSALGFCNVVEHVGPCIIHLKKLMPKTSPFILQINIGCYINKYRVLKNMSK